MRIEWALTAGCLWGLLPLVATADTKPPEAWRVYIGTYTDEASQGIYQFRLDLKSGALEPLGLAAETVNPSFLALHPNGRLLYAVNEVTEFEGQPTGALSAFQIDARSGRLTLLNQKPSHGGAPCHLVVDQEGRHVLVANYVGGNVAVLRIASDGKLGPTTARIQHTGSSVTSRQTGPHAHCIHLDPANRFAVAADLGLDKVLIYRFDRAQGTLEPNDPAWLKLAPGAGPRHFAFHPDGKHAYVINELNSTVTACEYQADRGALKQLQTLPTLPDGFEGSNSTAEVQVHPSGKFLYGSNRGHNSLAIFQIDTATGQLSAVGHQSTLGGPPRNFGIDPTGQFIIAANQSSDTLVVFRVNARTGKLKPVGEPVVAPTPVCVKFLAWK